MSVSRPAVHPVVAPPPMANGPHHWTRMKELQGMPGTRGGLSLRLAQFSAASVSVSLMASTSDFRSVSAFWYLVIAVSLQLMWSLSLAVVDLYALMVRRSLRKPGIVRSFAVGDGIMSTLTFTAACASAGITVLISNDLNKCSVNHCVRFETATAMAFISWFATIPSFFMNFWSLAST